MSAVLVNAAGWNTLNYVAPPFLAIAGAAALWGRSGGARRLTQAQTDSSKARRSPSPGRAWTSCLNLTHSIAGQISECAWP